MDVQPKRKRQRLDSARYQITIDVLDTHFAFWDADTTISFYDNGVSTEDIKVKDGLKTGDDQFTVSTIALDYIELMTFTRTSGLLSQWFVGKIEVTRINTGDVYIFPVNKWIKKGKRYTFYETRYATCLPQDDPDKEERAEEVQEQAKQYGYIQRFPGGPVQVKEVPDDEHFSASYSRYFLGRFAHAKLDSIIEKFKDRLKHILWSSKWKSFEDISERLYITDEFPKPQSTDVWQQDEYFGQLRLTGANHSVIKLCTEVPAKLFGNDSSLKQDIRKHLEGNTIEAAIKQKKLFIVDFEILDGLQHTKKGFHVCAPIALFYVNKNQKLMPVAIQLHQEPSPSNPLFLPSDNKYVWMMAKMWFNNADAAYHQSVAHLGFTHMLIEGFAITTHRNLDHRHPLYKLLLPHFLFLIEINELAMKFLVEPHGFVDETMNIGRDGMLELIAKKLRSWKLDVDGNLPEELKSRGVYDDVLPHYYYRDDALALWNIIMNYVTRYVDHYYDSSATLKADYELQSWAHAIVAPRCQGQGILGVPGVPENGEGFLTDKRALCKILTSIIFTSSVVHASVNFMQYDQYAYPPAYPSYLTGVPPTSKKRLEEKDVLDFLPNLQTSLQVMDITKILSGFGTNKLGDFPTPYITDPKALPIVEMFRNDLAKLSKDINKRNTERDPVYNFLNPVNIPNAISI